MGRTRLPHAGPSTSTSLSRGSRASPSYDEYVATLSRLTEHVDPTNPTAETTAIKMAADSLLRRAGNLRKIHTLWANGEIDGMYTVSTLDRLKADLEATARYKGLI